MPNLTQTLINNFALRSFRETADKDYITARMAYRGRLIQPYRWSALHCLEKYVKGILLLNRVPAKNLKHRVLQGIEILKQHGKFELDISDTTTDFIKKLEDNGANDRYYLASYSIEPFDVTQLDRAVWELRRYCKPLGYGSTALSGKTMNLLTKELDRIHEEKELHEKGTCISGGFLETVVETKDHPAREALIWNNLYFGLSRRKAVRMKPDWEAGNSPLLLHPEILDEIEKYVTIPKDIAQAVRQIASHTKAKRTRIKPTTE